MTEGAEHDVPLEITPEAEQMEQDEQKRSPLGKEKNITYSILQN